jgi:trehalose synthase-fused probable maltokinase
MDHDFNIEGLTTFDFPDVKWEDAFENQDFTRIFSSEILEKYIIHKRWYGGKASTLKYIEIVDYFKLKSAKNTFFGVLLEVNFKEAFYQHYFMPLAFMSKEDLDTKKIIASVKMGETQGYLVDALHQEDFRRLLFENIVASKSIKGSKLVFHKGSILENEKYEESHFMGLEQSNTSLIFNHTHVLKIFRRIYVSVNPDYEISRFLTERMHFPNAPAYSGSINMVGNEGLITLGLMQELVPNQGDAWNYMLDKIHVVFENLSKKNINIERLSDIVMFKRLKITDIPPEIIDWVGLSLFISVKKLALRTAEMHVALGSDTHETAFTPSSYNGDYSVW